MPCSQVPYCSCLCLQHVHVRSKGLKVMIDGQDSNLFNSGKLMVKISNTVMVVTTWHMGVTPTLPSPLCSDFYIRCLSQLHLLPLWQHCSLALSPTPLLRSCTVSHPLSSHAHPALKIQLTAPHSLSMHKKLNCTLLPTLLWCSCQVTMFSI